MSKFDEKNIIESLKQFSEMPSEKCWESIAQNLPPISPTPSNTNIDPSTTQQISQFFSTIAGKITAIATTAIVATSIGALYHFSNIEESTEIINNNIEIVDNIENNDIDEVSESNLTENIENKTDKTETISPKIELEPISENKTEIIETQKTTAEKPLNNQTTNKEKTSDINRTMASQTKNKTENIIEKSTEKSVINNEIKQTNRENKAEEQDLDIVEIAEPKNVTESEIVRSNKIEKLDVSDIFVPNVITPNNDGYNDFLVFKNLDKYAQNRLIVVNAKGSIFYERYQYDNSWDAINVPDGSYFFILEISDGTLSSTIQGVLQILR
jgi:gliding motility-associated-like protein